MLTLLSSPVVFLSSIALVAYASPVAVRNSTVLSSEPVTSTSDAFQLPSTFPSISSGFVSESQGIAGLSSGTSPSTAAIEAPITSAVGAAVQTDTTNGQTDFLLGPPAPITSVAPQIQSVAAPTPVRMITTVMTVLIPAPEQDDTQVDTQDGVDTISKSPAKVLSNILSDIPASTQQATPVTAGVGQISSAPSANPAMVSELGGLVSAMSVAQAQISSALGFIVPLSASTTAPAASGTSAAAGQISSVATPVATPASNMLSVRTLVSQVNSFVTKSNGSTAGDFPSVESNARDVTECASIESEMQKLLNSGILKSDGTVNTTGMGLPIEKTGAGTFMVSGSDIQLVSNQQNSSVGFQFFRPAGECDGQSTTGNFTAPANMTGKRDLAGLICWFARHL